MLSSMSARLVTYGLFEPLLNSPMASLCSCWTRINRVSVVDATADGESLNDLDTHGDEKFPCVVAGRNETKDNRHAETLESNQEAGANGRK